MEKNAVVQEFERTLFSLLEETFERVENETYLDEGTSLLETLAVISAQEASVPMAGTGASIAGHTDHTRFFLSVLVEIARGEDPFPIDWEATWRTASVTEDEWQTLQNNLRQTYQDVREIIGQVDDWSQEGYIQGALSVIVHTAYHLGAIRMALGEVRGRETLQSSAK